MRRVGHEATLGIEGATDRDQGAAGHDQGDDGGPDEADDPDQQDRRDDAPRLLVVQGEHEAALDEADDAFAVMLG